MRVIFLLAALLLAQPCIGQMTSQGNLVTQGNANLNGPSFPSTISAWGDSITSGNQDGLGDSYPGFLQMILNRPVLNEGIGGQTSHEILDRFQAAPTQWHNTSVICAGGNDYFEESAVLTNIAAMVSALQSSRYLIFSIFNAQDEPSGSTIYNEITADNSALAAAYPSNYIDMRELVVGQYNPANGCDVANHTSDLTPCSLRAIIQTGTLTAALTDTTSCPTLSAPLTENNEVLLVDSEYIIELTYSGSTVLTCTRGYGSTAIVHLSGAAYTAADGIHLSSAGYAFVAQQVAKFIVNHSY